MNVLTTASGRPHRNARDWPFTTYCTIAQMRGNGFDPNEIAKATGLKVWQVRRFIDDCLLSPTGGYAELKRKIDVALNGGA